MALTKEQWFLKLKSFVPAWFFETSLSNEAHMRGLAGQLASAQQNAEDHIAETFIGSATGIYLNEQGFERSTLRTSGEFDGPYRIRVQNLTNKSNCPALKAIVDKLLIVGEALFIEDYEAPIYLNRDHYLNRNELLIDAIKDTFSIIVDKQLHEPYSFLNRENFLDREDFAGAAESLQYIFDLILEAVETNKAFGTEYRILERLENG